MKAVLIFLFATISCQLSAQISVTGTTSSTSVPVNGPAVVVDAALSVSSSLSIPAFRVRVSANFNSGDVLAYTGSLPSGVTASYASGTGILTFTGSATDANYQVLLRTVTFATSSTATAARTVTFEAGDGTLSYNSTNNHFYSYISGSYTWTAAKSDAASKSFFGMHGYLCTITSSAENTFVLALSGKGWIGASDDYSQINAATGATTYASQLTSEGKWYWVTGPEKGTKFSNASTAVTYAYWNSGEPNNSGSTEHYGENAYANGYWNDADNTNTNAYVLEYGGVSDEPAVDIYHTRDIIMVATKLQTQGSSTSYKLHDAAAFVDPAINVYSGSSITDAKVTISGNFQSGDVLSYTGTLPSGITGGGYNSTTGVLSFSGTTTAANWQTLFRTVKFNSSSGAIGNRDITFSVGNFVAFTNGHFYESVTSTAAWSTAKTNAAAKSYLGMQGYLATITTAAENDFIKQKLATDAWIGLSDAYSEINAATGVTTYSSQTASEGKWYWVTGPEKGTQVTTANASSGSTVGTPYGSTYNNWNLGEPNNSSSNENYGEIYASGTNLGKWNDLSGTGSLQYVVEYGGLSSDPLVFLTANTTISINSILPVSGMILQAQNKGGAVELSWRTVAEVNCDHFDVLRSTDGTHYSKLGTVAGHGTTNVRQTYQWIDNAPAPGINYYKLQQVDIDERSSYSNVKQVTAAVVPTSLYPNPVVSTLVITHDASQESASLVIYSINGNVMLSKKISSRLTSIDANAFPGGSYIAKITDGARSESFVFIKQ